MIFFINHSVPIRYVVKDDLFLLELLCKCFFVTDLSFLKGNLIIVKEGIVLDLEFPKVFIVKLISDFDSFVLKFNYLLDEVVKVLSLLLVQERVI